MEPALLCTPLEFIRWLLPPMSAIRTDEEVMVGEHHFHDVTESTYLAKQFQKITSRHTHNAATENPTAIATINSTLEWALLLEALDSSA